MMMSWLWRWAAALVCLAVMAGPSQAQAPKVLRYAFQVAETGFDPAQIVDIYSRTVTSHIFEGLYKFDYLSRPYKVKPQTAAGMPEVSADYRVWTVRIKPGIYFTDDPAFGGRRRELVAADYVYSFKRFFDPAFKSPAYSELKDQGFIGLEELREEALKSRKPFDYNRPIEGIKAVDRYTVQFRLKEPRPRLLSGILVAGDLYGAVAREVVEHYGDAIMAHPVGTGPFVLKEWRRSSFIVLERNPSYREIYYDAQPNADDAQGQAMLAKFKGRRLPMVDRVEISIIEESQPRWLAFLQKQQDLLYGLPEEFANIAVPNGKLAPNLARQGIQLWRAVRSDVTLSYFNMTDPVVGGYTPEKVALRRAIGLAWEVEREIRLVRRGQAIPAQGPFTPYTSGYDPAFVSTNSEYDIAKAKALLDMYGYVDRDGDGWREQPDGQSLVLEMATQPDQASRQFDELRKKGMDAIGVRVAFKPAQWPENMKAARAGRLQMWFLGLSSAGPDGGDSLQMLYSPAAGGQNHAFFKLPAVDSLYERMLELPDGPQRLTIFEQIRNIAIAYAPYHFNVHRMLNDLMQPWLLGYRRPPLWQDWWQYVDVDAEQQAKATR